MSFVSLCVGAIGFCYCSELTKAPACQASSMSSAPTSEAMEPGMDARLPCHIPVLLALSVDSSIYEVRERHLTCWACGGSQHA